MTDDLFTDSAAESGAELLDDLHAALTRYVILPTSEAADAVTLWIAATHALPAFQHAPRLAIKSPEKRCGKSRLLDVIAGTCHRPLMSVNATVAAIFRSIGNEHPPTLLVDEADTMFGTKKAAEQNEEFRGLLNAGHQRGRPALRCVGPQQTPTEFPSFAMAALAGIGSLPDTITDRAVNITMRRRRADEQVSQFRTRRDGPILADLQDRLTEWGAANVGKLQDAEPTMPVEDRAADTWEPLVAVADHVGGTWPDRARRACLALTAESDEADEDGSLNTRLLSDVRAIFTEQSASFMASPDLVDALKRRPESPWDDFDFNMRKLAYRLKDFGVKPGFNTAKTARGYRLDHLHDAFTRYLRPDPSSASDTAPDLRKPSDASEASDGCIRPDKSKRPDETAGQPSLRTIRTGPDALSANPAPRCPDHPTDRRADNGMCIGCIVDRQNRRARSEASA
ncbi:MAG: DUF3631 domain-containing protein [Actinomycetota bacterium]|nr:DUF3631 domain-containing protein [Actinomycetota bacterium]